MTRRGLDIAEPRGDPLPFSFGALIAYLAAHDIAVDPGQPPRRCAGGLANLNYELSVDGKPAILRRAPSGPLPKGAHDMGREHRVLSALAGHYDLAPRSFHLCEDPSVIGASFQLMEFRKGRILRGVDLGALRPGEDLAGALCPLLADAMAGLHAIDPAGCGLSGLGRRDGFMARTARRWSATAEALTEGTPCHRLARETGGLVRAMFEDWPDGTAAILHCDVKLDNLMLAQDGLTAVALLDWDMATLGDPVFDLATLLSYWTEPGDPPAMQRLRQMPTGHPGFPTRSDMVAAYERASGRPADRLDAARALCQLKLAAIFLQLHARWRDGAVGDARYEGFEELGVDLLDHAHDVARGVRN